MQATYTQRPPVNWLLLALPLILLLRELSCALGARDPGVDSQHSPPLTDNRKVRRTDDFHACHAIGDWLALLNGNNGNSQRRLGHFDAEGPKEHREQHTKSITPPLRPPYHLPPLLLVPFFATFVVPNPAPLCFLHDGQQQSTAFVG